ncbi:hypothetical protein [Mariniphaga sp.]|uniref:hypothetical protein n=1 Tax=Mariniphaga sp. TaxID=1954475 RepID=UPI003569B274
MENSIICTTSLIPALYIGTVVIGNFIFYVLLLGFLIFPVGIFFVTRYFKKKIAYNHDTLSGKISFLGEQNRILLKEQNARSSEIIALKEQFKEAENKLDKWFTEKAELEQEIQFLKDQMQKSTKNDDIIIEYYMNEKSGD